MSHPSTVVLLSPEQASELLGVSTSTLSKWRVYGAGPRFAKLGSRIAYRLVDLENWIAERIRSSTSEPSG